MITPSIAMSMHAPLPDQSSAQSCIAIGLVCVAPMYAPTVEEVIGLSFKRTAKPDPAAVQRMGVKITSVESDAVEMKTSASMKRTCVSGTCIYYLADTDRNGVRYVRRAQADRIQGGEVPVNLVVSVQATGARAEADGISAVSLRINRTGALLPLSRLLPTR